MRIIKSKVVAKLDDSQLKYVIENTTDKDYELVHSYNRMDEAQEVIRMQLMLGMRDMPLPYKNKNGYVYFGSKKEMYPTYRAKIKGNKVELYELNLKAYNRLGF